MDSYKHEGFVSEKHIPIAPWCLWRQQWRHSSKFEVWSQNSNFELWEYVFLKQNLHVYMYIRSKMNRLRVTGPGNLRKRPYWIAIRAINYFSLLSLSRSSILVTTFLVSIPLFLTAEITCNVNILVSSRDCFFYTPGFIFAFASGFFQHPWFKLVHGAPPRVEYWTTIHEKGAHSRFDWLLY